MTATIQDRLVWVDLETTGLSRLTASNTDLILELGITITDLDLEVIDDFSEFVWETPTYDLKWKNMQDSFDHHYVVQMHESSGLIAGCTSIGLSIAEVSEKAHDFLEGHGVHNEPICGSTVSFDKDFLTIWMPDVAEHFSYRHIDVSSIKELCAGYAPDVYARLEREVVPTKAHRVLPDLQDTIREFAFYKANFLRVDAA